MTATDVDRRTYLGGPDASVVLGLNPYRTPEDVVRYKRGLTPDTETNYRMRRGQMLEPGIAEWYERTQSCDLVEPAFMRHPVYPFLGAHIDRLRDVNGNKRVIEIKTTSLRKAWGQPGSRDIPPYVAAQVDHYAMILVAMGELVDETIDVVADLGDSEPRIYRYPVPDPNKLDEHEQRLVGFWETYCGEDCEAMPEPSNAAEALARWPGNAGEVAMAGVQEMDLLRERTRLLHETKRIKAQMDDIDMRLKRTMGDAETLLNGAHVAVRWTVQKKAGKLDTKRLKAERPEVYSEFFVKGEGHTRRFLPREVE